MLALLFLRTKHKIWWKNIVAEFFQDRIRNEHESGAFFDGVCECVFYVKKTADMVGSGFDGNDIAFQSISISVIARMGAW